MDFEGFFDAATGDINDFVFLVGVVLYLGAFVSIVYAMGLGAKAVLIGTRKVFGFMW